MADRELNPSLPNESPGHWTVAPNLPLMTIPLEKKSNFFFLIAVLLVLVLKMAPQLALQGNSYSTTVKL